MLENDSLENYLFGPLDKKYCSYFYAVTIASFAFFLILDFAISILITFCIEVSPKSLPIMDVKFIS